ncbi:restriction endonuclease subunit S [Ammoniphilus resinae]|uniref:Restriction endonuclease S subunit n=1 Tax=Ammoniphilus resinae TaxID=861532 RepID=A0ABS4GPV3_9BACL|nr:restriction endonuclease S subunit [Ammoniphilus resinae]
MKLGDCTQLIQGVSVNRFETCDLNEDSLSVRLLTLKEFNETLGLSYRMSQERSTEVVIRKDKLTADLLTDTTSLIWHTLTQKVAYLPAIHSGLLISNNFIKVQFTDPVDLWFLEWYLNEHPTIQKQIASFSEGSVISSLKLSHLKDIGLVLPSLEKQQFLGKIAQLKKRKIMLMKEKMELQQQYLDQSLIHTIELLNTRRNKHDNK